VIDPVQDRRPPISPQMAWRVALLGGVVLAVFAVVFFRLWYLQVLSGDQYVAEANNNRVREERIPAPRGEIVDRHGEVFVTNKQAIVVDVSPAGLPERERELANRWGQLAGRREARPEGQKGAPVPIPDPPTRELAQRWRRLGRVIDLSAEEIQRRVIQSLAQTPYAPVRLRTNVDRSVLNYIQERKRLFPGIEVQRVYLRSYPHETLAAQLLGSVAEISPEQLEQERFRGVKQGTVIGQEGVEYEYDRWLRGRDGARRITVDAFGNPKGTQSETEPEAGRRLKLSLDLGLQEAGQDALTGPANRFSNPGAFVAMDPRNGEVLAMGSTPSFDPNVLAKPLTQERYEALFGEEAGSPRFNRAIGGFYATGSTFKPVTALAGLASGIITPATTIVDRGSVVIGDMRRQNAGGVSYGPVNLVRSLKVSSDVYYYLLGQQLDPLKGQVLQTWARRLGLGRETGIDLPAEGEGLVPDRQWRARVGRREERCRKRNGGRPCGISDMRPWSAGDNVNLAIGQGDLQASPLQMAVAYSAIVTDGKVPRPHLGLEVENADGELVQRIERDPARRFRLNDGHRAAIMEGLRASAMDEGGTSTDVFAGWPRNLPVYGKTGTAQTSKGDQSWYVAYVPAGRGKQPVVVAVTVEQGGFGAETAAPIARLILSEHFGVQKKVVQGSSTTR
jgi:penicillin-binding protein 2